MKTIFHFNGHIHSDTERTHSISNNLFGATSMSSRFLAVILGFILIYSSSSFADDTFDQETILTEASDYLGSGAEGLASVIERVITGLSV